MASDLERALEQVVSHLAASSGRGEVRPGQLAMAMAVEAALSEGRHLLVQAGTGTGKSLAYLVPAALSRKRVVVATATKALQDQLATKDLPLVAAGLPDRGLRYAVVKGRSNYLCRQRLAEAAVAGEQATMLDGGATAGEGAPPRGRLAEAAASLQAWARTTTTGDRAELADDWDPRLWPAFSVTAEECPGPARCPAGSTCFAEQARAVAAEADVVVANLHLLGAHVASRGGVLPDHDAVVVDEAHALEDVLTESLSRTVGAGRVRALASLSRQAFGDRGGARRRASRATARVDELAEAADRLGQVLAERAGERLDGPPGGALGEVLELLASRVERVEEVLRSETDRRGGSGGDGADQRAARAAVVAGRLKVDLATLAALGPDDVAWVEGGPHPALAVAPIDVGPALAEEVLSKVPVVLASATLPPGIGERLGVGDACFHLDVGSPFAYDEQGLLYCAAHLPDRRQAGAEEAMHEELVALIEAAGGRTLGLFTSRAAMERAATAVAGRIAWPLLVQGDAAKGALLQAFAEEPEACLFATMGFWQGVDVPGATCSCVVIDRIPFPRPDDPLVSARRERAGRRAFRVVDLPRAAALLAQGAGRLIRTAGDAGVVAVLDSRLANASYRWELVRALPPMRRTRHREEAEAFLRTLRARALADEAGSAPRQ